MSVIINDFEVVVEPPRKQEAETHPPEEAAPPALTPLDVHAILQREGERKARLRAH